MTASENSDSMHVIDLDQDDAVRISSFEVIQTETIQEESTSTSADTFSQQLDSHVHKATGLIMERNPEEIEATCMPETTYQNEERSAWGDDLQQSTTDRIDTISAAGIERQTRNMTSFKCGQHPGREIEYMCKSHMEVGCSVCMTIGHRTCSIAFIPELAINVASSTEFMTLRENIDGLKAHVLEMHREATTIKDKNRDFLMKGEADVHDFVSLIDSNVLNMEKHSLCKMREMQEANDEMLNEGSAECLKYAEELNKIKTHLESLLNEKVLDPQLFIAMKRSESKLEALQENLDKTAESVKLIQFAFLPNASLSQSMLNNSLGNIKVQVPDRQDRSNVNTVQCPTASPSVLAIDSDAKPVIVTGFCPLYDNIFLMADSENKSIKLVRNVRGYMAVMAKHELFTSPWDVAVLDDKEAFVSMPSENMVINICFQLVSKMIITQATINVKRGIKTNGQCFGLAVSKTLYSFPVLVITVQKPGVASVQIVNAIDANVLKEFSLNQYNNPIFVEPIYVTVSADHTQIFVSDVGSHSIVCLDFSGTSLWVFTTKLFSKPQGLCVGTDGNVYTCCSESMNITILTTSGMLICQKLLKINDTVHIPRLIVEDKSHFYAVTGHKCQHQVFVIQDKSIHAEEL